MIGILAEKPSAMRNMAAALGGVSGTYNGEPYLIVAARGHLYEFDSPDNQVDKALSAQYGSWDIKNLPWDEKQMVWKYKPSKDSKDTLNNIKTALSKCDEVCIGTDVDPTGEGELLAWEILDQLNISPKKWSRMYFIDESKKELQKAFTNRKQLQSMQSDLDYVKAFYRSRWDFLSMQFTRIATKLGDGHSVLRQGRLKSYIVILVGDALKALAAYKKVPYYQNKFRDENGVVYTNPEEQRYEKKEDVPQIYHDSDVVCDETGMKSTAPPKLLDLASLSARLVAKGYKAKAVSDTYQKMYESQVVSYPRTEDKVITPEQFNELLPLIDKIASVVGVDPKLLTHRTPRSTHVKTGGSHGANRPGTNVPNSLNDLSKYDINNASAGLAAEIYELLAKNYLATIAEDYEYEFQKGHIKDYPDFKGTASVPKKMGWKQVYDADAEPDEDENASGLGTHADPFIHEGFPPKPPVPTMKWLMTQLDKHDVGTGATRTSTYAEMTNEKSSTALMKDTKGKISLTEFGEMSYRMLPGTNIGSLDLTEKLMQEMRAIGEGKLDPEECLHKVQQLVLEDIETMRVNGEKMREELKTSSAEKVSGTWNGKQIAFKREWSGHRFTDEECEALLAGNEIEIEAVSKDSGNKFMAKGRLEEQEYKGRKYVGFKMSPNAAGGQPSADKASGTWNGRDVSFKKEWGGHTFTDDEIQKLLAGETISFTAVKKGGGEYTATGALADQEFKGHKFVGFMLNGGGANGKPSVPDEWSGHKFTDEEKEALEAGLVVEVYDFVSKKGNSFAAKARWGRNDKGYMGIIMEFS